MAPDLLCMLPWVGWCILHPSSVCKPLWVLAQPWETMGTTPLGTYGGCGAPVDARMLSRVSSCRLARVLAAHCQRASFTNVYLCSVCEPYQTLAQPWETMGTVLVCARTGGVSNLYRSNPIPCDPLSLGSAHRTCIHFSLHLLSE